MADVNALSGAASYWLTLATKYVEYDATEIYGRAWRQTRSAGAYQTELPMYLKASHKLHHHQVSMIAAKGRQRSHIH